MYKFFLRLSMAMLLSANSSFAFTGENLANQPQSYEDVFFSNAIRKIEKLSDMIEIQNYDFWSKGNSIDLKGNNFFTIEVPIRFFDKKLCSGFDSHVIHCFRKNELVEYFIDNNQSIDSLSSYSVLATALENSQAKIKLFKLKNNYMEVLAKEYSIPKIELNLNTEELDDYNKKVDSYLTEDTSLNDSVKEYLKMKLNWINVAWKYEMTSFSWVLERTGGSIFSHFWWNYTYQLDLKIWWETYKELRLVSNFTKTFVFYDYLVKKHFEELPGISSRYVMLYINGVNKGLYVEQERFSRNSLEKMGYPNSNLYKERNEKPSLWEYSLAPRVSSINYEKAVNWKVLRKSDYSELSPLLAILSKRWKIDSNLFDYKNLADYSAFKILIGWGHQDDLHNNRIIFDQTLWKYILANYDEFPLNYVWVNPPSNLYYYSYIVDGFLSQKSNFNKVLTKLRKVVQSPNALKNDLDYFDDTIAPAGLIKLLDKNRAYPFYYTNFIAQRNDYSKRFNEIRDSLKGMKYENIKKLSHIEAQSNYSFQYCSNKWVQESKYHKYECYIWVIQSGKDLLIRGNIPPNDLREFMKRSRINIEVTWDAVLESDWHLIPLIATDSKDKYIIDFGGIPDDLLYRISESSGLRVVVKSKWKIDIWGEFYNAYLDEYIKIVSRVEKPKYFSQLESISVFQDYPELDRKWRTYTFKNKVNLIQDHIILPKWSTLIIKSWTTVRLGEGISIVSYWSIVWKWTKDSPIVITSIEDGKPFGTIAIVQERASAEFENVHFSNWGYSWEFVLNGARYTGMVSAHGGERLTINGCTFSWSKSDDGLNIKRMPFTIRNSVFTQNSGDWLDIDFWIKGAKIYNSSFIDNGNDWLDLSKTSLVVSESRFLRNDDKWISVGEWSTPLIYKNEIGSNLIGIEIKDESSPVIWENKIYGNQLGISFKQKKIFFDPPKARLFRNLFTKNHTRINPINTYSFFELNWNEFNQIKLSY